MLLWAYPKLTIWWSKQRAFDSPHISHWSIIKRDSRNTFWLSVRILGINFQIFRFLDIFVIKFKIFTQRSDIYTYEQDSNLRSKSMSSESASDPLFGLLMIFRFFIFLGLEAVLFFEVLFCLIFKFSFECIEIDLSSFVVTRYELIN